jgi:hypothetical protein
MKVNITLTLDIPDSVQDSNLRWFVYSQILQPIDEYYRASITDLHDLKTRNPDLSNGLDAMIDSHQANIKMFSTMLYDVKKEETTFDISKPVL